MKRRVWGLAISRSRTAQSNRFKNSVSPHNLWRGICEPQLSYVDVNAAVFCNSCLWHRHGRLLCPLSQRFSWRHLHFAQISSSFRSDCVLCAFFNCLEQNLLLETFSRICRLLSSLGQVHQDTFVWSVWTVLCICSKPRLLFWQFT
jgi:hypothetical protein